MKNNNPVNDESFSWSDDAENIISVFYESDIMVYVEGVDDIGFWELIFKKLSKLKVEVQEVNGCENLVPYIEKISSGKIHAIVARDADLHHFSSTIIEHPNVIYTKGYAIENSMLNELSLSKILKNIGRYSVKEMSSIKIVEWFNDFYTKVNNLISLDIYNHKNKKGVSVVGDNCDRFMKSKKSSIACQQKIDSFVASLPPDFLAFGLSEEHIVSFPHGTYAKNWLRGHFLFSAIMRFTSAHLEKDGRKNSISKESFYSNMLAVFELYFDETHEDFEFYKQKISLVA
ncbi:DUF4435 domain-containing protein [Serratia proteamaculans]|uniref:DUF4435 domain-containing protein n=1 Tax=Serratia proteamaculans TaxID=28151 RepID=UPI0039BE1376